jgi:peptide/nickel transport system substrate-binding protein
MSDDRSRLSILFSMYESLVRRDRSGSYSPALAESWTLESDARTWTFRLRPDVSFHNGDILEGGDIVETLERVRDPEMGGELGTQGVYSSYLDGAEIAVLDRHTVRIVMAEPMADLLDLIVDLPIIPQSALAGLPDKAIGSGPFLLVDAGNDLVVMEAFDHYWAGRPEASEVHWRAVPEAQRRVANLVANDADIVSDLSPESSQTVNASAEAEVVTSQSTVLQGAARPLNGPLTPLHFGFDPVAPYPHDPEEAKKLLAETGHPSGMQLVLDVPTTLPDEATRLAQLMAKQFARVGIKTEIREFSDRPAYAEMVRDKRMDDAACFDSSPLSTYRILREKLHSGVAGPWWQGYTNTDLDMLIDKARATCDNAQRRDLYREAFRIVRDDAPWIFLYNPTLFWGVGPNARTFVPGIEGQIRPA